MNNNLMQISKPCPLLLSIFLLLVTNASIVLACTNILVTRGASIDGSSMISYNADSGNLMGMIYHYPEIEESSKEKLTVGISRETKKTRKIYDWDSGAFLGEIPEASSTYNVVGNTNAMGLTIAETTFGGIESLSHQTGAIMDYGSLIYVTLQRAKTAREAIEVMTNLMDTYGYASEGESFSLSDSTTGEVWILEVIGRGDNGKKGAVWVAIRIPDGSVAAHANQARITTFPRDDPVNCLFAPDVVDLALSLGLYERTEGDEDDLLFSFSDVYDPVTFSGARHGEARVWSIFSQIAAESGFENEYYDYISGKNLKHRMPLYIILKQKLSLKDIDHLMSSHYEGTKLSMELDVGAGEYAAPYRTRPLVWKYNDHEYFNERPIATQQTGWNFIAQMRPFAESSSKLRHPEKTQRITTSTQMLPQYLSSVLWFGLDDSSTSPRVPVYGCSTMISEAYAGKGPQDGVASPLLDFNINKAFWVQNMVSNFVYSRWNLAYPILKKRRADLMQTDMEMLQNTDELISSMHFDDPKEGIKKATAFSVKTGDKMHALWWNFYGELFAQFRDMFEIKKGKSESHISVKEVGFDNSWKKRIVAETKDSFEIPLGTEANDHSNVDIEDDDLNNINIVMLRGAAHDLNDMMNFRNSNHQQSTINKLDIEGF